MCPFKLPAGYTANSREALAYQISVMHDRTHKEAQEQLCRQLRNLIGAASPGDIVASTYTGR